MRFQILGPLAVWHGGRQLRVPGRIPRMLLGALLLEANRVINASRLMELVWGRSPPESGVNALEAHVSRLRRVIGSDRVTRLGHGYVCNIEHGELDAGQLRELMHEASDAVAKHDSEAASRIWREAMDLWKGREILEEFEDLDWLLGARKRFQELRLRAIDGWAQAELELGRYAEVVADLTLLTANYPSHEPLWHRLILGLRAAGRRTEAVQIYQRARDSIVEATGVDPSPALQRLHRELLSEDGDTDQGLERRSTERLARQPLPRASTTFVGRERELKELATLVGREALLTLQGEGGIGKTRLALEVAHKREEDFAGGAWLVRLESVMRGELVAHKVASVLGVREHPERSIEDALAASLANESLLLVLDNCEHQLDACAALVERLLDGCPNLCVLATSRERLDLPRERVWHLQPLALPGIEVHGVESLQEFAAIELFVERAKMAQPRFALTPENSDIVASICRQVDGLPLAIELAASRAASLPIYEIARQLDDSIEYWAVRRRGMPQRHQSMWATIDWSYRLLDDVERVLFRRLAAFAGPFNIEAAEEICCDADLPRMLVLPLITRLVDKSLLEADLERSPHARYRLFELARRYALELLHGSNDATRVHRQHAEYYASLAQALRDHEGTSHEEGWLQVVNLDRDNLREALSWAMAAGASEMSLKLALGLARSSELRRHLLEGIEVLDQAVAASQATSPLKLRVLEEIGWFAFLRGDYASARRTLGGAIREASEAQIQVPAGLLNNLGAVELCEEQFAEARRLLELSLAVPEASVVARTTSATFLGWAAYFEGDLDASAEIFERVRQISEAVGYRLGMASASGLLGHVAIDRGELAEARHHLCTCVRTLEVFSDSVGMLYGLEALARLAVAEGKYEVAVTLGGALTSLRGWVGARAFPPWERRLQGAVAQARTTLGPELAHAAWARGEAMSASATLAYAVLEECLDTA